MINLFARKKRESASDIRSRAAAIKCDREAELRRMINELEVVRVNERRKRESELDELRNRELELKKEESTSWSRMITLDNQIESARREISKMEAV